MRRVVPAALLLICSLLAGSAGGAEVSISTESDGTVVGSTVLSASRESIIAFLANPVAASRLSPDVLDSSVISEGRCTRLRNRTRGLFRPFEMVVDQCPAPFGFIQELVESENFSRHHQEWHITPVGEGSRVTLKVRSGLLISTVPDALVQESLRGSVRTMLDNLESQL